MYKRKKGSKEHMSEKERIHKAQDKCIRKARSKGEARKARRKREETTQARSRTEETKEARNGLIPKTIGNRKKQIVREVALGG